MIPAVRLALSFTGICLGVVAVSQADYEPYRYQRTYNNSVVFVGNGGCGCGAGGSRIEYAPSRYYPTGQHNLPTPPGIAGGVANGSIPEYRFDDLQPRYPATQGGGATYSSSDFWHSRYHGQSLWHWRYQRNAFWQEHHDRNRLFRDHD